MPPLPSYSVIEPHPSVPHNNRPAIHTSRGGAGNVISLKDTKTTDSRVAMGPPSRTRLENMSNTPRTFKSGRGGAGNVHYASERPMFSFDEELERELRRGAPVYHVGRGGAGNTAHSGSSSSSVKIITGDGERRGSSSSGASTDASSTASAASGADLALEKARSAIDKGWGKLRQ